MDFLGVRFEEGGRGGRGGDNTFLLPKTMVETLNLAHKFKRIFSFRKYTYLCQGPLNFADVSNFFAKNYRFLAKIVLFFKAIARELC